MDSSIEKSGRTRHLELKDIIKISDTNPNTVVKVLQGFFSILNYLEVGSSIDIIDLFQVYKESDDSFKLIVNNSVFLSGDDLTSFFEKVSGKYLEG